MSGRPKRRVMIAALDKRTRKEFGDEPGETPFTALDLAVDHVAAGGTILGLAAEIAAEMGEPLSREMLSRYLHKTFGPDADRRLREARAQGAHAMAEEARDIADNAPVQREAIQKAKLQADARWWLASRWNREDLGEAKGTQVTVTVGQLHLDALLSGNARRAAAQLRSSAAAQLPAGDAVDADIIDVEISDE